MVDALSAQPSKRALAIRPLLTAWVLTVGIDLFFNAGVFMSLFDQQREPVLLPDEDLFRRIPVAYLALLAGITALAWVMDSTNVAEMRRGIDLGAVVGVIFSLMGVVYLWTAIDMTGVFVAAGALVVIVQYTSAGWVLAAFRTSTAARRLTRRVLVVALLAALAGIIIQNLQP